MRLVLASCSAVLAACSGAAVLDGAGHAPKKTDVPADHYDAAIYLCSGYPLPPCKRRTTTAQASALRTRLLHDDAVRYVRHLSEHDSYLIGKATVDPRVLAIGVLKPGILPAAFVVTLVQRADAFDNFRSRYVHAPGVGAVTRCTPSTSNCSVSLLRRLHIVH